MLDVDTILLVCGLMLSLLVRKRGILIDVFDMMDSSVSARLHAFLAVKTLESREQSRCVLASLGS